MYIYILHTYTYLYICILSQGTGFPCFIRSLTLRWRGDLLGLEALLLTFFGLARVFQQESRGELFLRERATMAPGTKGLWLIWRFPWPWGTQKWMVFVREYPINMDDLGVPLFQETSIWWHTASLHSNDKIEQLAAMQAAKPLPQWKTDTEKPGTFHRKKFSVHWNPCPKNVEMRYGWLSSVFHI